MIRMNNSILIRPKITMQVLPAIFMFLIYGAIFIFGLTHEGASGYSLGIQIVCLLVATAWTIYLARTQIRTLLHTKLSRLHFHPAWLMVLAAVILRYAALSIFPPANQSGFEEIQTGSIANGILISNELPIEFRFTNILAALGFLSGEFTLTSMRIPFQILGLLGLVLTVFTLRSLKVSWPPTLFITFCAATLRLLVIASGSADESFFGLPLVTALLLCLIRAEMSNRVKAAWCAAAGICGGILMFEYTPCRLYVGMGLVWLLWLCFNPGPNETRVSRLFNLFAFSMTIILVSLPTIVQTVYNPQGSVFFEAFTRHGGERTAFVSRDYLFHAEQLFLSLMGWPAAVSAYFTPIGEPVIFPVVGWMFFVGFIYCLVVPGEGFPRALAIMVAATVIGASLFANDIYIGRMLPLLPALLLMSGIFLERIYRIYLDWQFRLENDMGRAHNEPLRKIEIIEAVPSRAIFFEVLRIFLRWIWRWIWQRRRLAINAIVTVVLLIVISFITWGNLDSLMRMARDPAVINEYVNNDYSVCAHVATVLQPGQRVYIFSPDGLEHCSTYLTEAWYFGRKQPELINLTDKFVTQETLLPGDLVALGTRNRGMTEDELSVLIDLGIAKNSLTSLQYSKNIAGRVTSASICIQCNKGESQP